MHALMLPTPIGIWNFSAIAARFLFIFLALSVPPVIDEITTGNEKSFPRKLVFVTMESKSKFGIAW